ncbi:MAG: hypothetical protein KBD78_01510 [Oligoflexales bacterium]|nr:hypothetical protein [Oligoflexales bacterium]
MNFTSRNIFTTLMLSLYFLAGLTSLQAKEKNATSAEKESNASQCFPDWSTPEFQMRVAPILGFNALKSKDAQGRDTKVYSSELGLELALEGIPLVPGNPGVYLAPYAALAGGKRLLSGYRSSDDNATAFETKNYTRTIVGLGLQVPIKFYKHTLSLEKGKLNFKKEAGSNLESWEVANDLGVMVLPHLSAHLTHTYTKAYQVNWSNPLLVMNDLWLHGRMNFAFLSMFFDMGPGVMFYDTYQIAQSDTGIYNYAKTEKLARSRVEYLKADAGMHIFWKLGATAGMQYIYRVSEEDRLQDLAVRLPRDGLNQSRSIFNQPEDTLRGYLFFGLQNIFSGVGLGWQYNYEMLNASNSKDHQIESNHGFGLQVSAKL